MGSLNDEIPFHTMDLYGDGQDSISIFKYNWGLFSVGGAMGVQRTVAGRDSLKKTLLIGEGFQRGSSPALYLADRNIPLTLAGRTTVRGTAHLPAAGIKRGSANGQPFVGGSLVYGSQKEVPRTCPR